MIKNKTLIDIVNKIQKELDNSNLPVKVKVDIGEPLEGADIGLIVKVEGKDDWELHKKINFIIRSILEEENLIAYIDWQFKE